MENLNREAILRMLSGKTGNSSSGGGGGDIDLAGYATSIWVTQNFVSIDFFRELFKAYDSNGNEVLPNDTETTIDNIKAMFGFWTDQYLSALGQGSGGGGGGGAEALSDLLDVELTTLQNGQALIYSTTLGKWTNGTAGVNMTQVWSALDSATNEQINVSHLTNALIGYVTTSAISDMATKSWVNLQGFATQTWVNQNFITIAFFDRLFQAYEGTGSSATRVNPNDTTSTIDNIKAMVGFWTEFYLSALGDGSASSGSISLGMLSDVSLSSPTDGQALVFDATLGIWKNGTVSGTDMATVWTNLAASTNEQINASHLTDALLNYNPTNNFKTINGNTIIGTGNITISGGGSTTYSYGLKYLGETRQSPDGVKGLADGAVHYIIEGYGIRYLHLGWDTGYYDTQIKIPDYRYSKSHGLDTNLSWRSNSNDGVWSSWIIILDSVNYSSYALPRSGGSLSGRLVIDYDTDASGTDYNSGSLRIGTALGAHMIFDANEILCSIGNTPGDLFLQGDGGAVYLGFFASVSANVIGTLDIWSDRNNNACQIDPMPFDSSHKKSGAFICNGSSYKFGLAMGTGNVNRGIYDFTSSINKWLIYFDASNTYCNYGNFISNAGVTALSDARHKQVLSNTPITVEQIAQMPSVLFRWTDGKHDDKVYAGTLAQNWQRVLPQAIVKQDNEEGTLAFNYGVAALVSSIITARKVVDHERRIAELERENKELKMKLKIA